MSTKKSTVTKPVEKTTQPKVEHVYATQKGVVIGRSHGYKAIATARDFVAESLDELKAKVNKAFDCNTLDTDLIFDQVIAAGVEIVDCAKVVIEGREFTNTTIHNFIVGDKEFFTSCLDNGDFVDTCPENEDL